MTTLVLAMLFGAPSDVLRHLGVCIKLMDEAHTEMLDMPDLASRKKMRKALYPVEIAWDDEEMGEWPRDLRLEFGCSQPPCY